MIIHTSALEFVDTIRRYLAALDGARAGELVALFGPGAKVHSPWLGELAPKDFFERLSAMSGSSSVHGPEVFLSASGSRRAIGYFTYTWTLADGARASFPCSDLFEFGRDGLISALTIVYDSAAVRRQLGRAVP